MTPQMGPRRTTSTENSHKTGFILFILFLIATPFFVMYMEKLGADPAQATQAAYSSPTLPQNQPIANAPGPLPTNEVRITKSDFSPDDWPLKLNEAILVNDNDAVYLIINGTSFATNGFARGLAEKSSAPDIEKSPYIDLNRTGDLYAIIKRGLALPGH